MDEDEIVGGHSMGLSLITIPDPISFLCAPLVRASPPSSEVPPSIVLGGPAVASGAAGGARYYLPTAKGLATGGGVGSVAQLIRCT